MKKHVMSADDVIDPTLAMVSMGLLLGPDYSMMNADKECYTHS